MKSEAEIEDEIGRLSVFVRSGPPESRVFLYAVLFTHALLWVLGYQSGDPVTVTKRQGGVKLKSYEQE